MPTMKMTTEEAFVKVLQRHGIEHVFGIIGSAFMPISDLFPQAGITFWDCAHEGSGGMMADGFTRASGRMSMMIAQNGPGITNFVTAVKTAYWNHTPLLLVTPQAANKTIGQGGFQEVEQMALFKDMVAYQEEVRDPSRIAEVLTRVIAQAKRHSAPAQINVPRDLFTQVVDIELPPILDFERPGGEAALGGEIPGHPQRRRRGAFARRHRGLAGAGRSARCAGLLRLSAQRRLPRLASAACGAARL
jgi:sulfoacetaldehyde acetyltransferase